MRYLITGPSPFCHTSLSCLKKIMYSRLYSYMEKNIYYTSISTGFDLAISRHCPSSVYMKTFQLLLTEVNILWGVFVDVAKAVDTVNHDLLPLKLDNMGIRGVALS